MTAFDLGAGELPGARPDDERAAAELEDRVGRVRIGERGEVAADLLAGSGSRWKSRPW